MDVWTLSESNRSLDRNLNSLFLLWRYARILVSPEQAMAVAMADKDSWRRERMAALSSARLQVA